MKLADIQSAFQAYYDKRHQGRKLTWLYHLSRGTPQMLRRPAALAKSY